MSYSNPKTLEQALLIALSVQEERQKFSKSFYASFDKSVRLTSQSPGRTYPDEKPRHVAHMREGSHSHSQRYRTSNSAARSLTQGARSSHTKAALRCYECEGVWHCASECPIRRKRKANCSDPPERRKFGERSRRSQSSGNKPAFETRQRTEKETRHQRNTKDVW